MKLSRHRAIRASSSTGKIPYNLVSSFVILRDYATLDDAYVDEEHKILVDIADTMFNVNLPAKYMYDQMLPEYKSVYDKYGSSYFDKVLRDTIALNSQISGNNVEDLIAEVNDLLKGY